MCLDYDTAQADGCGDPKPRQGLGSTNWPIWRVFPRRISKPLGSMPLTKTCVGSEGEEVDDETCWQHSLHVQLHGRRVRGWRVCVNAFGRRVVAVVEEK